MDLHKLCNNAIEAALAAGIIIQDNMNKNITVEQKTGGESYASQVVTEIDKKCEAIILSHLLPTCQHYDLALLSEETEDDGSRLEKAFFWCIDPMDGTLAFINKQSGFSVSIALVAKDGTPYIGVVYNPSTNTLYHAIKGQGAFKNKAPWCINNTNNYLTYLTDKTLENTPKTKEIKALLKQQAKTLHLNGIKEIYGAGSVMNAIMVLENGPACMLKLPKKENGGGSLWDFAATACVFKEVNLSATSFNGDPLDLNRKDSSFMNHKGVFYSNF